MMMCATLTGGGFSIGRKSMDNYFFCCHCDDTFDSDCCDLIDVLDKVAGREYVFECPLCGETATSELIPDHGVV